MIEFDADSVTHAVIARDALSGVWYVAGIGPDPQCLCPGDPSHVILADVPISQQSLPFDVPTRLTVVIVDHAGEDHSLPTPVATVREAILLMDLVCQMSDSLLVVPGFRIDLNT